MQVSNQLIYMSCFPQPFDKIFMCSLQVNHCHSQSLSLSECFEHNFILLSIDWQRNVDCLKKPSKLLGIFIYIYLFIYLFIYFLYYYNYFFILLLLLLLLVGDIPFSGDFNKSAVRWDQNKLFY